MSKDHAKFCYRYILSKGMHETGEEWPLLSVKTEVNGDSKSTFFGLVVQTQEIFVLPWLLWPAQYKIYIFLTVNNFNSFVPIPTTNWEGSHAGSPVSW